ncbi:MAG: type II secretion system F family protein [Acutalibacteraceae bacterium]
MHVKLLASISAVIGIALLLNLNAETVSKDILRLLGKKGTLREENRKLINNKEENKIYKTLIKMQNALTATGKQKQFAAVCLASAVLFGAGILLSILINNIFLMPALSVALGVLPFLHTSKMLKNYDMQTKEELETALSIITNSYLRNDDILTAVNENLKYIKPPLRGHFQAFVGELTAVTSDSKSALYTLRDKVDNEIFWEWCDTLIRCQDDRTLKDILLPTISKLTDVRIVNSELRTMLTSAKNEYYAMVAMVIGSVPLLYVLNKEWFEVLIYSTVGKATLGISAIVVLVTTFFMMKFTKPIEYRR